jgi:hypothetical protein
MTTPSYTPDPDDKLVPTMIYTPQRLIWGQLIIKQMIRVSIMLQTEMAPKYMDIIDAQVLLFGVGQGTKTFKFPLLHVETNQILAYHILPPADESPYYEASEPNRKMEPITAMVGVYRFDCDIRMAEQSDLKTYLGVQKGSFLPVFSATMSCPLLPSVKGITSPYALLRQGSALFAKRS